jgi:predicted enzyme related to lactoylglutathione lyase
MRRVIGIGGVFFKADDPEKLYRWYEEHLGLKREPDGQGVVFRWRGETGVDEEGMTVWAIFRRDASYFDPSRPSMVINYRVEDLDALLEALRAEGVEIDPKREDYEYGRFAWIMDPEGNKIELWEPPKPAAPARDA